MLKFLFTTFIFICSFSNIKAQQTTSFFNDYYNLNFQFGVANYTGAETTPLPNTLKYTFNNFISPQFGFSYDVLQTPKFNLKIGASVLLIREVEEVLIGQTEINNGVRDFTPLIETSTDGMWRLNFPITAEYIANTNLGKLTLNSSLIIGFHEEFGLAESEYRVAGFESTIFSTLESVYSRSTAPWYINGQLGVGMYFPFKGWMLRANIFYNFALQELYTGTFEFKNLQQSPDTSGNISFKGNSFGIEFSIYLAKKSKKE